MNRLYRYSAVALSALMLFATLSGCSSTDTTDTTDATTTTDTTESTDTITFDIENMTDPFLDLAGVSGDTVVATAGDGEITAGQYLYEVAYACDSILYNYYSYGITEIPWTQSVDDISLADTIQSDSLATALLYSSIFADQAKALGVDLTEDQLVTIEDYIESMAAEYGGEEILNYSMWEAPFTMDQYRTLLTANYYYNNIYEYYFLEGCSLYPTDDEVLAYAESEGNYNVKHILLKTISDEVNEDGTAYLSLSDEEIAAQLELAEDILAQLDASDDPVALFDTLMNEYSEDGRDATTGELYAPDGYVTYSGQMVTEFEEASMALDSYEYSGIVESTYGYHIILRLPLEVSEDYRDTLISNLATDLQNQWMEEYTIEVTDAMDLIDMEQFYNNLTAFRTQMDVVLEAMWAELETVE